MARERIMERRGAARENSSTQASLSFISLRRCFRASPQLTQQLEEVSSYNAGLLLVLDKSGYGRLFLCHEIFFSVQARERCGRGVRVRL